VAPPLLCSPSFAAVCVRSAPQMLHADGYVRFTSGVLGASVEYQTMKR
jgi:hypothetical protein